MRCGHGYKVAKDDKAPNVCCLMSQSSAWLHDALQKGLISSLAALAISLLPTRDRNPHTADVITASGSDCAGTNKPGSVEQEEALESLKMKAFMNHGGMRSRGELNKAYGERRRPGRQRKGGLGDISYVNVSLRSKIIQSVIKSKLFLALSRGYSHW
jgi:hypothetical protein